MIRPTVYYSLVRPGHRIEVRDDDTVAGCGPRAVCSCNWYGTPTRGEDPNAVMLARTEAVEHFDEAMVRANDAAAELAALGRLRDVIEGGVSA